MMDMPAITQKCPASSPLNTEAHQPTASIGSISMPHLLHSAPTPTHPSQNDKIAQLFNYRMHPNNVQLV